MIRKAIISATDALNGITQPRIVFVEEDDKQSTVECQVEGCTRPIKYAGLCGMHYKRKWRHGDVNTAFLDNSPKGTCRIEGCGRVVISNKVGLCNKHHIRLKRYGRMHLIKAERGSDWINAQGYRVFIVNGKEKYEHTIVAEKALGKPLPPGAVVHHMNNNPTDNYTPFNLIVCPDQAYHLLLHKRARELEQGPKIEIPKKERPIPRSASKLL